MKPVPVDGGVLWQLIVNMDFDGLAVAQPDRWAEVTVRVFGDCVLRAFQQFRPIAPHWGRPEEWAPNRAWREDSVQHRIHRNQGRAFPIQPLLPLHHTR